MLENRANKRVNSEFIVSSVKLKSHRRNDTPDRISLSQLRRTSPSRFRDKPYSLSLFLILIVFSVLSLQLGIWVCYNNFIHLPLQNVSFYLIDSKLRLGFDSFISSQEEAWAITNEAHLDNLHLSHTTPLSRPVT